MSSIVEWAKIFENLATEDLDIFIDAVEGLMSVEVVWQEFSWTGLKTLQTIALLKKKEREA